MGLMSEDMECCVCLQPYSRREKIPRMLHCKHTFCGLCLQAMSRLQSGLPTVCCPLCRWITCTEPSLTVSGSLWVNTEIWDQILDTQQEEEEEVEEGEWKEANKQTQTTPQYTWSPSRHCGLRIKLQNFLRRMKHNVL
ncbi:uncharacterized protein ACWYII_039929 isoform 1-T1 [Salvelinus alpinus]|uniref:E3 ubiquitin-protein ligase RNF186-like n=1 Tax=Salvelinus alpinus TaxID=8036 RepID=UPI0039FDB703